MRIKIAVGGCRTFNDREYVFKCLDEYLVKLDGETEIVFLSGHCNGVDLIAEEYAEIKDLSVILFPANWEKYGKAAGPIRNKEMVDEADIVIAFWDGKSRGTKSLIDYARKSGKELCIYKL